ncbi:17156_t:CDS:2, partial [Funneliformis geosporum]
MTEVSAGQPSKKGLYLAISPDGQYILTFNSNTFQIKIIKMENKDKLLDEKPLTIDKKNFPDFKSPSDKVSEFPIFKIAISNIFKDIIFVALSFVIENDMMANNNNETHGKTVIYRTNKDMSDHSFHYEIPKGGMVNFVQSTNEKLHCFIFNASGIFSYTNRIKNLERYIKQHYFYPIRLQDELTNLYKVHSCLKRIRACISDNHFLIEQYNEGTQSIQLFNLATMEMEQIFQKKLERNLTKKFARPIFSISKNKYLLMFSRGIETIIIFYIENGLEIARKSFGIGTKIMFGEFIRDDEGLLLIIKEKKKFLIKIWDLFSAAENNIQTYDIDESLNVKIVSYNARCPGNLLTVNADGTVSSIIEKWISNKKEISKLDQYDCNLIPPGENITLNEDQSHRIYHRNRNNTSLKPLVSNKEPWVDEFDYERISAYLDEEETIQLIIGRTTVQVWRENKEVPILEFIWANKTEPSDNDKEERESVLKIEELKVGIKSFYLKVKWVGNNVDQSAEIKWPSTDGHVTDVIHACAALAHVNCRKNLLVGYKKRHKFEKLMNYISLLIWKFIKKKQETWKLLDVRYNVMSDVIIGASTFLIKFILLDEIENNKEEEKTGNKRLLHIPQVRRWNNNIVDVKVHKEPNVEQMDNEKELLLNYESTGLTDLQIAIRLCSKDNNRVNRHIVIVGYLLEYYTTHATRNLGWLITVSKALPELYNHELLHHYAKDIFYKKCFKGLEMSHNIDHRDFMPHDIEKRRQKAQNFIAFCPNTKLVAKKKNRRLNLEVLHDITITIYFKIYQKVFPNPFKKIPPSIHIVPLYEFTT